MRKREDSTTSICSPSLTNLAVRRSRCRMLAAYRCALLILPAYQYIDMLAFLAEAGGFEPPIPFRVYRISSAAHSTTLARFLVRSSDARRLHHSKSKTRILQGHFYCLEIRKRAPVFGGSFRFLSGFLRRKKISAFAEAGVYFYAFGA